MGIGHQLIRMTFNMKSNMKDDSQICHRRSIRLKGYDYTSPGGYFITLVAQGRVCLFGDIIKDEMQYSEKGQIAYECWRAIPDHFPSVELGGVHGHAESRTWDHYFA